MILKPLKNAGIATAAYGVYGFLKLLGLDGASWFAGKTSRLIGPRLGVNKVARRNLKLAFPDITEQEMETTLKEMWENLGRVAGEMPHLKKLYRMPLGSRVEIEGLEHFEALLKNGQNAILASGHFGNWEIITNELPKLSNADGMAVYRPLNNKIIDKLILEARSVNNVRYLPKGPQGAREILKGLKQGAFLGLLMDQKMNDGISVPFFGKNAMSPSAGADLALKFNLPLLPVHVTRIKGAHFRLTFNAPIQLERKDGSRKTSADLMQEVHTHFESWLKATPSQWLWPHKRWP